MRQILQEVFEQAEWRQPSVVLLDDLDDLTHTPTSPEHEHGPEALLQQHVAQSKPVEKKVIFYSLRIKAGLKTSRLCVCAADVQDVVDEVLVHSSLVCLLITSQSEHTLHPSLTQVQGSHFIQGLVNIRPPEQVSTDAL